jgi:hypothetical protein
LENGFRRLLEPIFYLENDFRNVSEVIFNPENGFRNVSEVIFNSENGFRHVSGCPCKLREGFETFQRSFSILNMASGTFQDVLANCGNGSKRFRGHFQS